jgi:hypothetical protein
MSASDTGNESVSSRVADRLRGVLFERGLVSAIVPSQYLETYFDSSIRREEARVLGDRATAAIKRARFSVWTVRERRTRAAAGAQS